MTRLELRTRLTPSAAAVLLAGAMTVSAALGSTSNIPPPETGTKLVDLKKVGSKWEMRDAQSGKLIMQERNCVPETAGFDPQVQRVVEIRPQPTGYDMVVTFTNPTGEARQAGGLYAGMFTLGPSVTYFDFRYGSQPVPADFATFVGQQFNYPDSQYSPVWVVTNGEYAIGVSLLYPMLEYQHDVRIGLMNPTGSNSGEGGPGWAVGARISNKGTEPLDQQLPFPAMIPAGQERTYVLCVRVWNNPSEWARTLLPYRKFFRDCYGGVTYRREGKPIQPVVISESSYLEPSNPMGFTYIASRRPDVFGWKPWTDALKLAPKQQVQMLWAPSGLYYQQAALNFPFQMTSHWQSDAKLATALDPSIGLRSVADSGVPVGLWWGRCIEIANEWEPAEMIGLDPDNPEHRAAAFREMDMAVQAGVTFVGLDTFSPGVVQLAKLYHWLHDLRERYPTVRFIVEPNACDMLHTLAGSFISGWKDDKKPDTVQGLYRVTVPHALADFLVPGHETVLGFRYNGYREYFNTAPNPDMVRQDMEKFAAMGYTPAIFEDQGASGAIAVARTWETTVPPDLRLSPAAYPLKTGTSTALGNTYRPTDRQTPPGESRDSGGGGPGVSTFSRLVLGPVPKTAGSQKTADQGTISAGVSTIVNSSKVAGKGPSSVGDALAKSSGGGVSSATDALNRAGFFTAISSKGAKNTKSKSAVPIKVVPLAPSSGASQTAAADKEAN